MIKLTKYAGFTLMELLLVITIVILLATVVVVNVDPVGNRKKAMDTQRLNDVSLIERAVTEFRADNGSYPDANATLRTSNVLPAGGSELTNSQSGWIAQNLRTYTTHLPIDPVNDATYHYSYIRSGDTFEINAKLIIHLETMQNDGGNDPDMYEVGNNKDLISP